MADDELEARRTNIGGRYGSPTVTIAWPFSNIVNKDEELRDAVADLAAVVARLASPAAVESWLEQSPEGLAFAVKMSRYMTHIKRLTMVEQGTRRFYERLQGLAGTDKFGPVLWQFPPNFHRDSGRLAAALPKLRAGPRKG